MSRLVSKHLRRSPRELIRRPLHRIVGAIFSTAGHEQHRMRRVALAKFFARAQVLKLEPKIQKLAIRLCDKILAEGKNVFDVTTAYSCFSSDVISDYAFGDSFGFLDQKSWEPNFRGPLYSIIKPVFMFRFFPFTRYLSKAAVGCVVLLFKMSHLELLWAKLLKESRNFYRKKCSY